MSAIIKCHQCGANVDVSSSLKLELEREYELKFKSKQDEFEKEIRQKRAEYKKYLDDLQAQKNEYERNFKTALNEALKTQLELEKNSIKDKIERENKEALSLLKAELDEKSKQLVELNLKSAELERVKREKDELEANLKAKAELEYTQKLSIERDKITKDIQIQNELKLRQKDDALEAMKKQIDDLKRRAEQGNIQAQGETQELAIEEWLMSKFPLDNIQEIGKGVSGGDCIQVVNTMKMQNCGKIYYESKRTKNFSNDWIAKFKNDMRIEGADIGVLVTQTMPKELDRVGLLDGIWVCSYDEFKGICAILRESIISLANTKNISENRADKMSILYEYLTSSEFRLSIESIINNFTQMQDELNKEKTAMAKIWKKREKQIEQVLENTASMYGSLQGIAGSALLPIKRLELEHIAED